MGSQGAGTDENRTAQDCARAHGPSEHLNSAIDACIRHGFELLPLGHLLMAMIHDAREPILNDLTQISLRQCRKSEFKGDSWTLILELRGAPEPSLDYLRNTSSQSFCPTVRASSGVIIAVESAVRISGSGSGNCARSIESSNLAAFASV